MSKNVIDLEDYKRKIESEVDNVGEAVQEIIKIASMSENEKRAYLASTERRERMCMIARWLRYIDLKYFG